MKLYVDLETLRLIEGPGFRNPVNALRFKRGDGAALEVAFLANGQTPVRLGESAALKFGVKPRSRYDLGYIVFSGDWILPDVEDANPVYQCRPSFNTEELDAALNVGSPTASELAEIILMGEISWTVGGSEPTSTRTFQVIVENDVNRGTEGVPVAADPAYPQPQAIALLNQVVRFDTEQTLTPEQQERVKAALEITAGMDVLEFATDANKLAASGLIPGTIAVITEEGGRIEQFLGEAYPPNPDLLLATVGESQFFITRNSSSVFVAVDGGGSNAVFYVSGGSWAASGAFIPGGIQQAAGGADSPADADWSGTTINSVSYLGHESEQKNWAVLRNTVYLSVTASTSNYIVNDEPLVAGTKGVGWVDPHAIPIRRVSSVGGPVIYRIRVSGSSSDNDYTQMLVLSDIGIVNKTFSIPHSAAPRSTASLAIS